MAYQETTRQSYGNKVKGSFQGILWGLILIIAGTVILWWNEGRAVKASDALKDFQKNYVELQDITTIDPAMEGKAVHATGVAVTADTLRDAAFGIAVNAMKLNRHVEYYQWTQQSSSEKKDKLGGSTETTTTYTYEPAWCSSPVNSNDFKDPDYQGKNFVWRVIEETDQNAANVTFGAYRLTDGIVSRISGEEPAYPVLTDQQKKQLLNNVTDSTVVVTITGDQVYIGADPSTPRIGDVRITFTQVTSPKTISLLQKVVNGTFESYVAKNGKQFSKVEMGTVSAENMISNQKSANKAILWLLRILGIILVIAGNRSLLNFISTVFAVVPFVQRIIGTGVGLVATVVGLVWSAIVIAVAWIAHRPVLAIALLVIAAALIFWLVTRSRKKKISDVAAILVLVLALGLSAGCTKDVPNTSRGGDLQEVASIVFKGPVKTIHLTTVYQEGEPFTTVYEFDQKGNLVSEKVINDYEEEGDYGIIESLSEKDADGRYTKEVWGFGDQISNTSLYEYDEAGRPVRQTSYDSDGNFAYETRTEYDDRGREVQVRNRNLYSENVSTYEYDENGRQNHSVFEMNGEISTINDSRYDEEGRTIYSRSESPKYHQIDETYHTFRGDELIGTHQVRTDGTGTRTVSSDTTFTGTDGLRHQRMYYNYDDEHAYEGTFNKQGCLTHYEFFQGKSNRPALTIDFTYTHDGKFLTGYTAKQYEFGEVKKEKSRTFGETDTFGNWTEKALPLEYLPDLFYTGFDDLDNFIPVQIRDISYYGDDQGQNYGFEGKVGQSDLLLTWTNDHGVVCGEGSIDGDPVRIVGVKEEGGLHIRALKTDGLIPWHIILRGDGNKREGTFFKGPSEYELNLKAVKNGLKTYSFSTVPEEIVGLYRYSDAGEDAGEGTLDVSRFGENWEEIRFEIANTGPAPSHNMAADTFTGYMGESTDFYQYLWSDGANAHYNYKICFYDGFAVVQYISGDPTAFFGMGMSVVGVYAKLPSVG